MWADIRDRALAAGPSAEAFQQWETQHVRGMNASGQIAVQAVDPTGHYRGLILTPLS